MKVEGAGGAVPEVSRLSVELRRLAGGLLAAPTLSLSVRQKVAALQAVEAAERAVEAARLAVIRSLSGDDVRSVGAVNLAGLLRDACKVSPGRARADIAVALAVDPDAAAADAATGGAARSERGALAGMGQALAAGEVSRAHLDVAVRVLEKVPTRMRAGAAGAVDEFFVRVSGRYAPWECERLAAELLDHLDPDRADRGFDPDAFTRRRLDLVVDSTGMVVVRGQLDPMTGAQLKAAIEHFAAPDPAARDEDGLITGRDLRTPSQRRADALGVIASRGLANAGSRGGEPPRVLVHVTAAQLSALATGTTLGEQTAAGRAWCDQTGPLAPGVLDRIGCGAIFERVLLAPNGAVLNLGRAVRLATAAQRRALAARDHGCVIPGCDRPASQTDAHHVNGWAHGALTDIDELVLLCGPHHNAVHAGIYQIVIKDGIPWVRPPAWLDPDQPLTRNTIHDDAATARETGRQIRLDLGLDEAGDLGREGGPPDS